MKRTVLIAIGIAMIAFACSEDDETTPSSSGKTYSWGPYMDPDGDTIVTVDDADGCWCNVTENGVTVSNTFNRGNDPYFDENAACEGIPMPDECNGNAKSVNN